VLYRQANWSRPAAALAAQLALRFRDMKLGSPERIQAFCTEVWSETVRLSARAILNAALGLSVDSNPLADGVCRGRPVMGLAHVSVSPIMPLVAVGGPAVIYYGEVAKRLACKVVFTENCDVANAVGAAAGVVALSVIVTVEGDGNGAFRVHGLSALEFAARSAEEKAARLAAERGAVSPRVVVNTQKYFLPDAMNDDGLLKAEIIAEAVGRPMTA
jgi:hypothetical protein